MGEIDDASSGTKHPLHCVPPGECVHVQMHVCVHVQMHVCVHVLPHCKQCLY